MYLPYVQGLVIVCEQEFFFKSNLNEKGLDLIRLNVLFDIIKYNGDSFSMG